MKTELEPLTDFNVKFKWWEQATLLLLDLGEATFSFTIKYYLYMLSGWGNSLQILVYWDFLKTWMYVEVCQMFFSVSIKIICFYHFHFISVELCCLILDIKPALYSKNKLHLVKCIILYLYCYIFLSFMASAFKFLFLKSLSTIQHRDTVLLHISKALILLLLYVEF